MALEFVEVDPANIEAQVLQYFQQVYGETLYPGDARRLMLQGVVALITQVYNDINAVANENLLRYAVGRALDELGQLHGVERLAAKPATATVRFFKASGADVPEVVTVPAGTRVTTDGSVYFSTTDDLIITSEYGDIEVTCNTDGAPFNDILPGQITTIVDPVAYVTEVVNTTPTAGGIDIETDEALRERIRLAPEQYSCAGSSGAYEYHAKSADASIIDVAVSTPDAGEVLIVPLCSGGTKPSADVLAAVEAAISARDVRPLTDHVTVQAPRAYDYSVNVVYYVDSARASEEATIKTAVEAAVDEYVLWQRSKIGRPINPARLNALMVAAGAVRTEILSPAVYTTIAADQVAIPTSVTVTYAGLEG